MAREDQSGEFTGVLAFFLCLCTLLVLLRCYCKLVIVKNFAADHYFSVLTLISFLFFCALALLAIQNGTGKRRYLVLDEKLPTGMKWWWSCEPTYVVMNIFFKFSIGIFLLRIAVERNHRIILWTALIATYVYSVYFFFIFTFQCWHLSFFGNNTVAVKATASLRNSFIVPIFIVHKLQMNTKRSGSTATIVRIPFIHGLHDTSGFLYFTIDVAIWSTCETGIGLATLRPVLRQAFGELSTNDSTSRKHSRMWDPGHPSRSGYREHPSHRGNHDIELTNHDSKHHNFHIVGGGGSSPSGGTIGLHKDWEEDKESWTADTDAAGPKGIIKTVKIT
ncbi:hypothetical protein P171DRAFT_516083 [Karstenula rhodostoma CBS 690.94]|uniref:Rhodopsin domain-containing protein n=1 Tax=Karstenula rhodostoma CBS 690.94 TaxID=1392251 RepID=A0A9P4PRT3_9PLEO|nr:hypothetical protein P171DRAFT_516083 [Karstenula rhodostoma CBS 690.94]